MTRILAAAVSALVIFVTVFVLLPFAYDGYRSSRQRKELLSRSDYPQIAAACVTLARAITNDDSMGWSASDPFVPPLLRSLAPRQLGGYSNYITMEFHGAIDHYGYSAQQSDGDPRVWNLYYYSEHEPTKLLATITNN